MEHAQANTATSTYEQGQTSARAHQRAARALRALARAQEKGTATEAKEAKAWALADAASATDLAFADDGREGPEDRAEAHATRANALFDRKQSRVLRRYRDGYENTISHSGSKSKNNGDAVAIALAGLAATVVMAVAEQLLGMEKGELATKYEKLNEGQKRMNSGNRIRNAVKKGTITPEQIVAEININQG